jgi:hypothetical protein
MKENHTTDNFLMFIAGMSVINCFLVLYLSSGFNKDYMNLLENQIHILKQNSETQVSLEEKQDKLDRTLNQILSIILANATKDNTSLLEIEEILKQLQDKQK